MKRRNFFRSIAASGVGAVLSPVVKAAPAPTVTQTRKKPETNIATAKAIPRTINSMPGKYPGKVVKVTNPDCIVDGKPSETVAYEMIKQCLLHLTGETDLKKAWRQFVGPEDIIGLKVNPIGGRLLSTTHAVTKSVVRQLEEAGISRSKIVIWDRRQEGLDDADFNATNYPGVQFMSTECYDENKSYISPEGRFYSEEWIDKEQFYYADVEGEYDAYTLPYMVNGGKNSYFTKICTEKVTKIINLPVVKNAGTSVTICMKNLAFGAITNTGRLHQDLWHDTCAHACAFPPLRDKVVLNIADGLYGCFDGGPAANPQFICRYNTILAGTDPVAVDRIGYDIVLAKRIEEGIQREERPGSRTFMEMAEELQLGIEKRDKIELIDLNLNS
ncbi:DUF362 domain-containing protein [Parabacteroides sp. PF5-9]|uniref:DUF362 domain-containing protein n=1 Tax=Parabacteroides sp. PF5-9 TaxID=1742404 RepID=UPI0024754575|nr:DUF362 domain-containing protein [Parabacteroides sp. PF5-9]MDH6358057.1 hypothetical protein [Parabacteroides sp. PF5-9]